MDFKGLSRIALACLIPALSGAPVDETLAIGRKALFNDGVATAWKLSQQALAQAPDSAAAHEFAGEVLFRRGDFAQAEAEFQAALKRNDSFALAWWGLAQVAECSSMHKTAEQYVRRAHELAPADARIFRDWAMRLRGPQHIEALERYVSLMDPARTADALEDLRQHIQLDRALGGRKIAVLATPYQKTEIPLLDLISATTRMRNYGLEAEINSNKLRLILDTGASGILITRRTAERAGVVRLSNAIVRGFGNSARLPGGYRGVAQSVRVGGVEYRDGLISVSDQDSIGTADGLIGTSVFSEFLVTLDFAAKKLRLDPIPGYRPGDDEPRDRAISPDLQTFARVFRFGHLLLLPTRVSGVRDALFVIDSGSEKTLISSALAAEVTQVNRDDRASFRGVSGKVADVYQTGDLFLEFAGFRQKNLGMTAFDLWDQSRRLGTEISGFLGLPLLDLFTLTIDYPDGLVNFDRKGR